MRTRTGLLTVALAVTAFAHGAEADLGEIRLKGRVGEVLDRMVERHVAGTDVDYITAPFLEKTETTGKWQTEFWGKWMHAAVPFFAYSHSEKLAAAIERGLDRILASQEPCGYIGNYPDKLRCGGGWDVWGMKYTMMGLLHYVQSEELSARSEERGRQALEACKRLCDYVIGEVGPNGKRGRELWSTGGWAGLASSSILEPVVWLYRRTGEKRYLDFADFIVRGMREPATGPRLVDLALKGISVADRDGYGMTLERNEGSVGQHSRRKAYEMMSCYQGLLDYVQVKSEESRAMSYEDDPLFKAAVWSAEDIAKEEVNLAGGCACSEQWFHGAKKQHLPCEHLQETCVTITWMRLCQKLLAVTGDPKWADRIERTFYNAYLGALNPSGAEFEAYTALSGSRYHGMHHCWMHTDCCTSNGPRGFLVFLQELFRRDGGTATFNFYTTALVKGFDMYSLYPRTDAARIVSHTEGKLELRLRIPSWSAKTEVTVNGEKLSGVAAGTYFTVARDWKLGDIVEIRFDMPVVAHRCDRHLAFTRGPVLLARDSRFRDGDLAEPFRKGIEEGQALPAFVPVRTPSDDFWMTFSATLPVGGHVENPEGRNGKTVFFCDFASAGNSWRCDDYYRTWFPELLGPRD